MPVLALLPSPLLGPAVWETTATALRDAGRDVLIADLADVVPSDPSAVLASALRALPSNGQLVLVPHSNAGLYVPALTAARRVSAVVFVDAALPPFDALEAPTANESLYEFLAVKADAEGLLPRWTEWWDEDLDGLFPDAPTRQRIERQQRRLPLSYFRQTVPVPPGWDTSHCAYLAFGGTYQEQFSAAQERGWPVHVRQGGHLEMTIHPSAVAADILALLDGAP